MPDARVEILDRSVAFDGYFQIIRYRVRHRQFAGGMGPEVVREVFEITRFTKIATTIN